MVSGAEERSRAALKQDLLQATAFTAADESALQSQATSLISALGETPVLLPIFIEGVLHCLDPLACSRLKAVSPACQKVLADADRCDPTLRQGRHLFLRNRHNDKFKRRLILMEIRHSKHLLWWLANVLVAAPVMVSLAWDFRVVPKWCSLLPLILAPASLCLPSGFSSTPHSGIPALQRHESALWKVTEDKLFSGSDRFFLKCWSMAALSVLFLALFFCMAFPGVRWLPVLSLLPAAGMAMVPILQRYRQTREGGVARLQVAVSMWITATLSMTWALSVDSWEVGEFLGRFLTLCGAGGNIGELLAILFGVLIISFFTVAYPAAFTLVNFYKRWTMSGLCGLCVLCMEVTVLVSFSSTTSSTARRWPTWAFTVWIVIAGCICCGRLAYSTIFQRELGFTDCWVAQRTGLHGDRFVFPPLLPPTISAMPFEPRWRTAPSPRGSWLTSQPSARLLRGVSHRSSASSPPSAARLV